MTDTARSLRTPTTRFAPPAPASFVEAILAAFHILIQGSMSTSRASSSNSGSPRSAWSAQATTSATRSATRPAARSTRTASAPHSSWSPRSTGSTYRPPASSGSQLAPRTSLTSWMSRNSSPPAAESSLQQPLLSTGTGSWAASRRAASQTATQSLQRNAPPSRGSVLTATMSRLDSLAASARQAQQSYTGEGSTAASLLHERVSALQSAAARNLMSRTHGGTPSQWDDATLANAADFESHTLVTINRLYGGDSTANAPPSP